LGGNDGSLFDDGDGFLTIEGEMFYFNSGCFNTLEEIFLLDCSDLLEF